MLIINLLVIIGLIIINALLSLSEMAVVSSRRARLLESVEAKRRGAAMALELVENPGRLLSTVQAGITLIGVLAGAFGGATLAAPLSNWLGVFGIDAQHAYSIAFMIVVALTTFATLIIGELVPKYIALRQPERVACMIALPISWVARIFSPLIWLLEASTRAVLIVLGVRGAGGSRVTEGEVRTLISEGTEAGVFDPREQAMIDGVLRLDDRSVRTVMVPRPDVVWLDINDTLEVLQKKLSETGFSRFLVCDGEIDEVIGIVRTRDILDGLLRGESIDLKRCIVPPMVVLDTTPVIALLDQFKNARRHMAIVVDEYGGMVGIATMTDVVEVIAGDLPEHWEDGSEEAQQQPDGSWLVDGMMDIEDFETKLNLSGIRDGKNYHTVAGFVLSCLQSMPTVGEQAQWEDLTMEVLKMQGHRIDKVRVTLKTEAAEAEAAI